VATSLRGVTCASINLRLTVNTGGYMSNKDIVVFDLDGTLANGKHRNHLVPKPEDAHSTYAWDEHNLESINDTPIQDTIDVCNMIPAGLDIVVLTGRCEMARDITERWLCKHQVAYDKLIMRGREDHRPDTLYKEEELLNLGLDNILCCYDDLEHVATMMRGLGLTCYLVNKYNKPRVNNTDNEAWSEL